MTSTGRELCDRCYAELLGGAAGLMAGGGDVGNAVAVQGWFVRLREARRRRNQPS